MEDRSRGQEAMRMEERGRGHEAMRMEDRGRSHEAMRMKDRGVRWRGDVGARDQHVGSMR
jgi:hypothetical protein